MADDLLTAADFVADALDLRDTEISDLTNSAPFFLSLPMEPSSNGNVHKYSKETGAPVVGFRTENNGRDLDHSEDTSVTVNLKILDFGWEIDVATAHAWKRGKDDKIAREGRRHLREAMFMAETQYFGGTVGGDAAGFTGFADASGLNGLSDAMVVGAGGTTAGTGSSVYFIRKGIDRGVAAVMIEEAPFEIGETLRQQVVGANSKKHWAYCTDAFSWMGLQIGGAYSVGRIANLTEDAGKGLTDTLLSAMLEKFPTDQQPDEIVMNRRSRRQWKDSRTATRTDGADAPLPTEYEGIPVTVVESITNTETLLV